jgi:hypothetical protein
MATINVRGLCPGGNHLLLTVTTSRGSRDINVAMADLRAALDETDVEKLVIWQLASIIRENPGRTLPQLRNIVESATFRE